MAVKKITAPEKFTGLSTDTKPTDGATSVRPGATFYEYNTGQMYITYDGTNWVAKAGDEDKIKTVSVTKALAAASAYDAADVLSESATNGVGTAYTFSAIARYNGAGGEVTKAHVISEATGITPRLVLYLFTAAPTCELDDHAANTALLHADQANYIGRIDFPAMSENGTGGAEAVATESTYGNLPLTFTCPTTADDLFGVLVTMDAFTQTAGNDMIIKLTVRHA